MIWVQYVWVVKSRTLAVRFWQTPFKSPTHSYLKYLAFFPPQKREIGTFAYWKPVPFSGFNKIQIKKAKEEKQRKVLPCGALASRCSLGPRHTDYYHNVLICTRYHQTTQSNQILKAQRMCTEEHPVLLKHEFEFCDRDRGVEKNTRDHPLSF